MVIFSTNIIIIHGEKNANISFWKQLEKIMFMHVIYCFIKAETTFYNFQTRDFS